MLFLHKLVLLGLDQLNYYDMTLFKMICLGLISIEMTYFEIIQYNLVQSR